MKKLNYPQIPFEQVEILWETDYYDGPLSGVLLYQDEKHWFECEGAVTNRDRYYLIYKLSPDQIKAEEERHEYFQKYTGTESDKWKDYCDQYPLKSENPYKENEIIGWCVFEAGELI